LFLFSLQQADHSFGRPFGSGKRNAAAKVAARFWDINPKIRLEEWISSGIRRNSVDKYAWIFQDVSFANASYREISGLERDAVTKTDFPHSGFKCAHLCAKSEGYHTIIARTRNAFVGGERQRVSIARALLKDAPIILLDEATASLDVENETKIQAAISELVRNKTVLIIAHRMRTVANADHVVVLENGTVVEDGSPEALKKQNGLFARMLSRQIHSSLPTH
jgi:ATP-binding cassette subfamily B protein